MCVLRMEGGSACPSGRRPDRSLIRGGCGSSVALGRRGAGGSSRSDGRSSPQPGRRHQRGFLARQQVRVMPWGGLAMWLGGSAAPLGWTLIGRSIDRTQAPAARLEATSVCGSRQRVRRLGGFVLPLSRWMATAAPSGGRFFRPDVRPVQGPASRFVRPIVRWRPAASGSAVARLWQTFYSGVAIGSRGSDPCGEAGQLCPLGWRLHGFVLRDGGRAGWSLWQGGWGAGRIHVVGGGAGARDSLGTEGLDSVLRAGQRRVCPLGRRLGRARRLCWEGAYPVVAMGRWGSTRRGGIQASRSRADGMRAQQPGRRHQRGFRAAASWGFDLRPRLHNR